MLEFIAFALVLTILCIFDIWAMRKKGLKKELLPYLILTVAAAAVGAVYLLNPYGDSIAKISIRLLGFEE